MLHDVTPCVRAAPIMPTGRSAIEVVPRLPGGCETERTTPQTTMREPSMTVQLLTKEGRQRYIVRSVMMAMTHRPNILPVITQRTHSAVALIEATAGTPVSAQHG